MIRLRSQEVAISVTITTTKIAKLILILTFGVAALLNRVNSG
jgi:hypothetical protein